MCLIETQTLCRTKSANSENSVVVRIYLPCSLVSIQEFWISTPGVLLLYAGYQKPQLLYLLKLERTQIVITLNIKKLKYFFNIHMFIINY